MVNQARQLNNCVRRAAKGRKCTGCMHALLDQDNHLRPKRVPGNKPLPCGSPNAQSEKRCLLLHCYSFSLKTNKNRSLTYGQYSKVRPQSFTPQASEGSNDGAQEWFLCVKHSSKCLCTHTLTWNSPERRYHFYYTHFIDEENWGTAVLDHLPKDFPIARRI